jgi:hypothetical protein
VSTIDRIAIRRVAAERATVISGQSFDAVLAKLAAAVGHPDMSAFARDAVLARLRDNRGDSSIRRRVPVLCARVERPSDPVRRRREISQRSRSDMAPDTHHVYETSDRGST